MRKGSLIISLTERSDRKQKQKSYDDGWNMNSRLFVVRTRHVVTLKCVYELWKGNVMGIVDWHYELKLVFKQ